MATQTAERVVHAFRVADIPKEAKPAAWTAPKLAPKPALEPLSLQIVVKREDQQKQQKDASSSYVPEQGMVFIPEGEFIMGDEKGAKDEMPQRTVTLDAYWMDRYPVTNAAYQAFVEATGYRKPAHWRGGTFEAGTENHPVTNVNLDGAQAYATWAGKRLPTEAEYEKAARGTQGQVYPWGDGFRNENVNSNNDYGGTTPVDQFPDGASPFGAMDMCGNVMEWCSDWYFDQAYQTGSTNNPTGPAGGQYKVARGGFYAENKSGVRCASRHYAPPATMQDHIGFRCAKTPLKIGQAPPVPAPVVTENVATPPKVVRQRVALSEDTPFEQIADDYPENIAKIIRTMIHEASDKDSKDVIKNMAALFIGLGQNTGAEICKYITDAEIEQIAQAIVVCNVVTPQQKNDVFDEIKKRMLSGDYLMQGGSGFARGMLEKSLGPRKANAVLDRVSNKTTGQGFYMLRNVDPNQIVPFLSKEHPQTIALILSQLDATQAAGVLNGLSSDLQSSVVQRIANLDNISPRVMRELEQSLAKELQQVLSGQITKVGGPKAAAEILNRTGRSTEKNALKYLDEKDPQIAEAIRNQMFVYDDIANLTDREIQLILKQIDSRDLAVGLKGGCEELKKRIFANVSEEAAKKIKEEMQFSGPVRMSDVEDVQLRTVQLVRQLEEAGEITIVRGDNNDKFV